ncbi:hypothetical protein [Streptomyces fulvorobeus]|uniref:Integral membrane protein n=1 Tax=Streptomyces fulvorobeus TaxID=284028 RepID=A0A7J0CFP8_9ACTN|nr:hypothetical protein [Streptomyces fulvorobeus]NYE44771.1 hypothetical protein [Streptomyces fulvorobeus]GFN01333.1 hypothetical protein Sfulv_61430 [Streptomyces fulvorobeus]
MKNTQPWKSFAPVAVNLLLGIPAIVPCFLVWYVLSNGPLAELGWTSRDPNEDDGILLWLVIVVPVVLLFGGLWGLVNIWLRRRLFDGPPPYPYWLLCATASLVPFFVGISIG